jgi:hypothetical protein
MEDLDAVSKHELEEKPLEPRDGEHLGIVKGDLLAINGEYTLPWCGRATICRDQEHETEGDPMSASSTL